MTNSIDPNQLPDFTTMPNVALMDTSHVDKSKPPFLLIDGSYYMFSSYHALPKHLNNGQGLHTNAIRGFLNSLNKLIRHYRPMYMAVAFDTKAPTFRHVLSGGYKANRKPIDQELIEQIPYVHQLVEAMGIPMLRIEGAEADDIIGTLAHRACQMGHPVIIASADKDMAQLVNETVILEELLKSKTLDIAGVQEKYNLIPNQIVDYLTLMGDASDGIKGVPKVGNKTAIKLLNEYQTLENILANASDIKGVVGKNLVEFADNTVIDKQMATIITNLEVLQADHLDWETLKLSTANNPNVEDLRKLYEFLDFKNELKSIDHPNHPANQHNNPPLADASDNHTTQSKTNHKWHTVIEQADFDSLIERLQQAQHFAIDTETTHINWKLAELVGISVALQAGEAYYIPLTHGKKPVDQLGLLDDPLDLQHADPLVEKQLDRDQVLATLRPILADENIGKIGQHLKYDAHIFAKYGITINNWHCDTMLASYVINASATPHNMDSLAEYYLHTTTTKFEEVAGKGVKQVAFNEVDIKIASDYACEDADITYQLFSKFEQLLADNSPDNTGDDSNNSQLLQKLELPTAQLLASMEEHGILINRAFLATLSQQFTKEIANLEQQAYDLAGEEFNIASPKQLGVILFDTLQLKGGKKTRTGQYSTSEAVLKKIEHPLVDLVLEYRSLSKLKSTYTDALGKVADPHTDRVHTSYHQALTSTGRLSSTAPNLQNIPIRTDTGRQIRQAFIAPKGRVIMAADYSQIELRLMAHFSADPSLITAFQQGIDIHTATASEVLQKPISEITDNERRNAKAVNFGLLYGMTEYGLAKQLGTTAKEAKQYIYRYFQRYTGVNEFMSNTQFNAQNNGYVRTILHRRLYTPDINNSNHNVKQGAIRAAINAPLQGSAADIIKLAMIAVDKVFTEQNYHTHAKMLLQVHDELVFEVDQDKADDIAQAVKIAMEGVLSDTAQELGWDVDFSVPLVVEVGQGDNWDEAH